MPDGQGCRGRVFAAKIADREVAMNRLLPTTLVGSYAQPDWLIDR